MMLVISRLAGKTVNPLALQSVPVASRPCAQVHLGAPEGAGAGGAPTDPETATLSVEAN